MSSGDLQRIAGYSYIISGFNLALYDVLDYGGDFEYMKLANGYD